MAEEADKGGDVTFAGKFKSPQEFSKGFNEIRQGMGLKAFDGEVLFGEGGQFADSSAAEAAYAEMETMQRHKAPDKKPDKPDKPDKKPAEKTTALTLDKKTDEGDEVTIESILEKADLDPVELAAEWDKNGKLTDEQYTALKEQGRGRSEVNAIMRGQRAIADLAVADQKRVGEEAAKMIGSKAKLDELLKWASANLDADVKVDVEERLADPKRYKGALEQIKFMRTEAGGESMVDGDKPGRSSSSGYTSRIDFAEASAKLATLKSEGGSDATLEAKILATPEEVYM